MPIGSGNFGAYCGGTWCTIRTRVACCKPGSSLYIFKRQEKVKPKSLSSQERLLLLLLLCCGYDLTGSSCLGAGPKFGGSGGQARTGAPMSLSC